MADHAWKPDSQAIVASRQGQWNQGLRIRTTQSRRRKKQSESAHVRTVLTSPAHLISSFTSCCGSEGFQVLLTLLPITSYLPGICSTSYLKQSPPSHPQPNSYSSFRTYIPSPAYQQSGLGKPVPSAHPQCSPHRLVCLAPRPRCKLHED